jgi:hypothetical protein
VCVCVCVCVCVLDDDGRQFPPTTYQQPRHGKRDTIRYDAATGQQRGKGCKSNVACLDRKAVPSVVAVYSVAVCLFWCSITPRSTMTIHNKISFWFFGVVVVLPLWLFLVLVRSFDRSFVCSSARSFVGLGGGRRGRFLLLEEYNWWWWTAIISSSSGFLLVIGQKSIAGRSREQESQEHSDDQHRYRTFIILLW